MSRAGAAGRASSALETALLGALARLAKKGAYAAPTHAEQGAGEPFGIFSPRNAHAGAIAILPADAVTLACRRGWLRADGTTGRYRLAAAGIEALRRARSASAGGVADAAGASPTPRSKAALAAAASQRLALTSPLAWLRRHKDKDGQRLITEPQFTAGERLASDYWHAQLNPRVTVNWSAAGLGHRARRAAPGVGVDLSDHVIAARNRVHRAVSAVGPELAGMLVAVCCHDIGLEAAERAQGLPHRSGKVVLQMALTALARHYGLIAPQPPPDPFRRPRHWGADDYRPTLDAWRS